MKSYQIQIFRLFNGTKEYIDLILQGTSSENAIENGIDMGRIKPDDEIKSATPLNLKR